MSISFIRGYEIKNMADEHSKKPAYYYRRENSKGMYKPVYVDAYDDASKGDIYQQIDFIAEQEEKKQKKTNKKISNGSVKKSIPSTKKCKSTGF